MPFTALAEDIGLGVFPLGEPVSWLLESEAMLGDLSKQERSATKPEPMK
jgi:hypothetical protein